MRTEYETVYVHTTDEGQVEFYLSFTLDEQCVENVSAIGVDCEYGDDSGWMNWFKDQYDSDREFQHAVDAECLRHAGQEEMERSS